MYKFKRVGKEPILISLTCFLFFTLHIPSLSENEASLSSENSFHQHTLTGTVTGAVIKNEKTIQFLFQTKKPQQKYLVIYFPTSEEQDVYPYFRKLNIGATCQITGSIVLPEQSRNPGQFDYRHYLKTKGISYQIMIDEITDINCEGISILGKINKVRESIQEYVLNTYSEETAAWMIALVLGDDSFIEEKTINIFRNWGLSHLLAISGLHVGLIVGLIYFILIKTGLLTKEKAQWFMLIFLPIYALLAGGEPSVWRASIMVFIFIILTKLKINLSISDVISIVFLLLIMFDRFIIYHIGFQFSFIVTFSLILSRKWLSQPSSLFYQLLKISFISQMVILPFQFIYFSMVQPLSILLNVIVVPYFSFFIIPCMFIMALLSPLPLLPLLFDKIFITIHSMFIDSIEWLDSAVNYPWVNGSFPLLFAILYYAIFSLLMISITRQALIPAFKYGLALTLLITFIVLRPYISPYGSVTMLDIGQGDAFIIEFPYRKGVIFIDAGATFSFDDRKVSDRIYKQVLKPYLFSKGIQSIDAIFISHEDVDHMGSVDFLVEEFNVNQIFVSPFYVLSEDSINLWNKKGIDLNVVQQDQKVIINSRPFNILSPGRDMGSDNENSLVIQTEIGGKTWLFTGDIGVETEKELMKNYPELSIDVLKVGHHGSKTSTDETFVNHINPYYALVSVGERNTYGHPSPDVMMALEEANVVIMRTDEQGAIIYRFKKDNGTFFKYLP